ncbi:MAG: methyltransferase domain-containing protein [Myxococcota bacterium]
MSAALGFNLHGFLEFRARTRGGAAWLDLCCGSGWGLIDAAERLGSIDGISIQGVDPMASFAPWVAGTHGLTFTAGAIASWKPARDFDLITCARGLDAVGDRLGLIARAAGWLVADGVLLANLDLSHLKMVGRPASLWVPRLLERAGLEYDRRQVRCRGRKQPQLPLTYLGASGEAAVGGRAVTARYRLEAGGRPE